MANYDPSLLSNSFRVKDREAFAVWVNDGLESELMIDYETSDPDRVVVYGATFKEAGLTMKNLLCVL